MNDIDLYLKGLNTRFPVPADCPAYTLVALPKKKEWWNPNYVPYRGKLEWCARCILHGNYCDGFICIPNIKKAEEDDE